MSAGVCTWGDNTSGQGGTGASGNQYLSPVGMLSLTAVDWVDGGEAHAVMLDSSGGVWTVGDNTYGQLGLGDTTPRTSPVQVSLPMGATMVAAGARHTLAVLNDGSAYAWGDNTAGQLGDGTTTQRTSPVQVVGVGGSGVLSGLSNCGAGAFHSLFMGQQSGISHVYSVGANGSGQLGDGSTTDSSTPLDLGRIQSTSSTVRVTGGDAFSMALQFSGRLYMWGDNSDGALGLGDTTDRLTPTQTATGVGFIGAGSRHAIWSKDSDGTLHTAGFNGAGQLGDGSTTDSATWINVGAPGGKFFTGVDGMAGSTLARADDGTVYAVGEGSAGQLGNGAGADSTAWVQVSGVSGAENIGAGANTGYAISPSCTQALLLFASVQLG